MDNHIFLYNFFFELHRKRFSDLNRFMSGICAFIIILEKEDGEKIPIYSEQFALSDSLIFSEESRMGFWTVQLRFNSNEFYRNDFQNKTKEVLRFGKKLRAVCIFLSLYEYQMDLGWIEREILTPIVLEELGSVEKLPLEKIWKREDLTDKSVGGRAE